MTTDSTTAVPKDLIEALWHLDGARERRGWDAPPDLIALYEVRCPTHDTVVAIAGMDFPGWPLAMSMTGHSYHAMQSMIFSLRATDREAVHRLIPPPGLVGVVLIDETWTVAAAPAHPARRAASRTTRTGSSGASPGCRPSTGTARSSPTNGTGSPSWSRRQTRWAAA